MLKSYLDLIAYVQRAIEEAGGVPLDLQQRREVAHQHDDKGDADHGNAEDHLQLSLDAKLADQPQQHKNDDDDQDKREQGFGHDGSFIALLPGTARAAG